jgi:hypothetical protein
MPNLRLKAPATVVADYFRLFVNRRAYTTFNLRNVVDDQDLKEQVDKARALLEGVSTDELRNMPLVRASVREGMASIAAQMDVLVNDRVSRKFRFDEA